MAVSKRLRFEILRRDNHQCRYCGRSAPEWPITVDHVVPTALGGSDDPSNLVAACKDCNAGKSSVPADSAVVDDVSADALRWAKAMEIVAQGRAAERIERQKRYDVFEAHWNSWTYRGKWQSSGEYERLTYELPGGWFSSVDQFLNAGLEMEDLTELVDIAMGSRSAEKWRYFCGCCWRRITESQERAKEIISQKSTPPSASALTISTRWTQRDLDYLLSLEGVDVKFVGPLFACEEHSDGLCETDTLCQIVSAARTRESLEAFSIRKRRQKRADEKLNDAADESEVYAYG